MGVGGQIFELELHDEILLTGKRDPAAVNRYVYYPDHLVRMPGPDPNAGPIQNVLGNLQSLISEPIFKNLLKGVITEPMKVDFQTTGPLDESVAEFVARRLNHDVADNLVSAVMHGIYAGDIDRLSAQAVLGQIRTFETPDRGVLGSLLQLRSADLKILRMDDLLALESVDIDKSAAYWKTLGMLVANSSVMTFKNGVGQLAESLLAALNKSDKVHVITNADIKAITQNSRTADLTVSYGENQSQTHNRIVATNSSPSLAAQLSQQTLQKTDQSSSSSSSSPSSSVVIPRGSIKCLQQNNYAATVMVVNLYYDEPDLLPVTGFGYLIPRSIPYDQNPERALGVIFGSDSSVGQDTARGTKLTVMLGGHWWDDWQESDYPDHDTAVQMACSLLHRHLGITDAPQIARSRLQRNAIPQYTVGHMQRMRELSRTVREDFKNRLTLAGAWYGGVGVADCIRQAYLAASYGVGAKKLDAGDGDRPWRRFDWEDWELEGGLPMAPVPWVDVYRSERKHF